MPAPRVRDLKTAQKLLEVRREAFNKNVDKLAGQLSNGKITVLEWRTAMRQEVKDLHVTALVISRGGEWNTITQAEWGRVGHYLRDQYGYLNKFGDHIQQSADAAALGVGNFASERYIAARSHMYGGAAKASFWRGVTYGLLSQVPGDGKTICRTNCGCHLEFKDGDMPNVLLVFWMMNPALENCPDCIQLSSEWNPLMVTIPPEMMESADEIGLDLREVVKEVLRMDFTVSPIEHMLERRLQK